MEPLPKQPPAACPKACRPFSVPEANTSLAWLPNRINGRIAKLSSFTRRKHPTIIWISSIWKATSCRPIATRQSRLMTRLHQKPDFTGMLPYAIMEEYERLAIAFSHLRRAGK